MNRSDSVYIQVSALYVKSGTVMGKWMWYNHVQWVADKAKSLAEKYGADPETAYCGALLHDLADCHYERDHKEFRTWSEAKGEEILLTAGFKKNEAKEIIEVVIRPHSCHPGSLPTTVEGKILSTADALFHLQTGFFPMLCFMHRPENAKTYESWQRWFSEKIDREYHVKIFFKSEKAGVNKDYRALSRTFRNTSLRSQVD